MDGLNNLHKTFLNYKRKSNLTHLGAPVIVIVRVASTVVDWVLSMGQSCKLQVARRKAVSPMVSIPSTFIVFHHELGLLARMENLEERE